MLGELIEERMGKRKRPRGSTLLFGGAKASLGEEPSGDCALGEKVGGCAVGD
jgi:hypothetical protein